MQGLLCTLQTQTEIALKLQTVKVGGRVGMALDKSRRLHLYVDGEKLGTVAERVKEPAYTMFDLLAYWKKVSEHKQIARELMELTPICCIS